MCADYVYACVLSEDKKSFLVARKKQYGYFFQYKSVPRKVLNFSGQDVLPGGGLPSNYTPENGALKEFQEETGINIKSLTINATKLGQCEFNYEHEGQKGKYYGVFFTVPDLVSLRDQINRNLEMDVSEKIKHVEDDELNNIEIYNFDTAMRMLSTFNQTQAAPGYNKQTDKSWFANILNQLK